MELEVREIGGVTLAVMSGRLDAVTAEAFGERLAALVERGGSRLLLDLEALAYLSSMGLRKLVLAAKRLGETGGRLAVCGCRSPVREVLQLTGFDHVAPSYTTRDEALASFREP